jgi:pyruvate formate lyase activating enzyme
MVDTPSSPGSSHAPGSRSEAPGRADVAGDALDAGVAGDVPLRGRVAKILNTSAVDGPGNRAVVFLQGCSFDCAYCHNPETRPPITAKPGPRPDGKEAWPRWMTSGEVLASIGRYRAFLRGITVTGGECGEQPGFLQELLREARAFGLPGLVDTNGSLDYEAWPGILEAAEGFMLDIKAWDEDEHRALTGSGNAGVLRNLDFLARVGALYEIRTVIVPGLFDAERTVRMASRALARAGSSARYKLIRFRPQGVRAAWRSLPAPGDELMERLAALAADGGAAEVLVV